MIEYKKYAYSGPVLEFGNIVANCWEAETFAPTEKKARSNLAYQFKKYYNREARTQITLPGKLMRVEREEISSWKHTNQILTHQKLEQKKKTANVKSWKK